MCWKFHFDYLTSFFVSQTKVTELTDNLKACKEKLKSLSEEENKYKGERVEFDKVSERASDLIGHFFD